MGELVIPALREGLGKKNSTLEILIDPYSSCYATFLSYRSRRGASAEQDPQDSVFSTVHQT
jgi:hypothetical protein